MNLKFWVIFLKNFKTFCQIFSGRTYDGATLDAQMFSIMSSWTGISLIDDPHPLIQLTAVQSSPSALFWINNPTKEVQLYCIKQDYKNLHLIQCKPCQEALELAHAIKNNKHN